MDGLSVTGEILWEADSEMELGTQEISWEDYWCTRRQVKDVGCSVGPALHPAGKRIFFVDDIHYP